MKKTNYIKSAFISLIGMTLLSSCLKDSRYVDFAGSKPLIELPSEANVGGAGGPVQTEAFTIQPTPSVFKIAVNIAAPKPLGSALTVKLGIDQAGLDAYNATLLTQYTADTTGDFAQGITPDPFVPYSILPTADYSADLSVTIPAGQNLGYVSININSSLIDPAGKFILPVKIIDGGGQQISNYDEVLYIIGAKNKYDGEYTVTGSLTDALNATITGAYPEDVYLETIDAGSDSFYDVNFAGFFHEIDAGASYYGNFAPIFTFDSNNNVTAVTNVYGQGTNSQARAAALDPTGINKFTSGTPGTAGSVFKVSYFLVQAGVNRTEFTETFTYVGARP